ncbi:hypothetical protein SAICODRAFT_116137 [Saitoella complicata NRRL Y-17804]|nr:uncharacterized protein SAICODRAFT_116137 [Saitoella complicata NRRL Y-17804]ODQ53523.1 hypothetical protein SAICODRAFT_116137 [Saitoella complicata NRRL Y-17804]
MSFIEPHKSSQWTPTQFWSHMLTFPTTSASPHLPHNHSHPTKHLSPRLENTHHLLLTSLPKIAFSLLLFRCIPPPASFFYMSFSQARLYMALLGFILLISLEGFVGGFFAVAGLVGGVRQRGMFRRVWRAGGFRDLWARRWNLPVHEVLHVVVFERVSCPCCKLLFRPETRSRRDSQSVSTHETERKNDAKKRGPCENATAALFTFLLSGLAHEYLTWMSAGHVRGINILYFLLNGLGCTLETFYFSGARRPGWVYRVVFLVGWVWASEVYTCGYVESGFFEEAKVWMRMFGVECGEVVWLFGRPAKWDK